MEVDTDTLGIDGSLAVHGSGGGTKLGFAFPANVKTTEPSDENAEAPCLQPHESALIPFTHSYLGELHDVPRRHPPVIFSHENYRLPIIKHSCVMFPGQIVPVWVGHHVAPRMLLVAHGESQLAGYVVMVWPPFMNHQRFTTDYRGCIAKVLKISEDGKKALVQGVCVCKSPDWETDAFNTIRALSPLEEVLVLALPETCPHPGTEARSDLDFSAKIAMAGFRRNYPLVRGFEGDPVQVAYWLAANTPLPTCHCQMFLRPPLEILKAIRALSAMATVLTCTTCNAEVADAKDLIQVVDQGPCPVCVNPGGFTHKIICVGKELRGAKPVGPTSSECTWFPGYACQMMACACGEMHLGWVFTALSANMPIQKFWGLAQNYIWHKGC